MRRENRTTQMENVSLLLRVVTLFSGIYQTLFGETDIGLIIILCFFVITVPSFFTRNYIKKFPIEIEVILFIMVIFQFVLGEARDFYTNIPYYDKIVHYMVPMLLGIIGFIIFYTMYATKRLQTTTTAMMFIIIFITMGIGATWEIIEYCSDTFIEPYVPNWHHFQGNAQQDPLTDTMTDLIDDLFGAIFGALLGLWLINRPHYKSKRLSKLIREVSQIFYLPRKKRKKKTKPKRR